MIVNLKDYGQSIDYFKAGDVFMIVGLDRAYMILPDADVQRISGVPPDHIPVLQLDTGQIVHVQSESEIPTVTCSRVSLSSS